MHATLLGMLAGAGQWTQYGSLMVTDAAIRVAIAAAAFGLGWGLAGFLWATVGGAVAWLLLGVVSVRLFSFTPGQFAFGLRVASIDHRAHVGVGRALARGLLVFLVVPVLFADGDGRGLQDKLTGTAVVRR